MNNIKMTPNSINPQGVLREVRPQDQSKISQDISNGDSFLKQIEKADQLALQADSLKKAEAASKEKPILKFSNHAVERMSTRGITFTPEQITKIEQGMQKASAKGARETLVLTDDSALIVSLKNNTVVTVMDKNMMKENVFTNIDSTVFV